VEKVTAWDLVAGKEVKTFVHEGDGIRAVAVMDSGRRLLCGGASDDIYVWDTSGEKQTPLSPSATSGMHRGDVAEIKPSPDGQFVAAAYQTGGVVIWDWASRLEIASFPGTLGPIYSIAWSPDCEKFAFGNEARLAVYEWRTSSLLFEKSEPLHWCDVEFSPDGATVLGATWTDRNYLFDAISGENVAEFASNDGVILSAHRTQFWSNDKLLSSGPSASLSCWAKRGNSLQRIARFDGGLGYVVAIASSTDGQWIATGNDVGRLELYKAPEDWKANAATAPRGEP
jgi:WD40 repeat protein